LWTAPLTGGTPITGYIVYKNGIQISDLSPEILSLSITDNISAGVTYQVSVSAYNGVGEGEISDNLEIMAAHVPDAPTNVQMLSQSSSSIQIEWDTPYDGGTPLTTYKVFSDLATNGVTFTEIEASTGLVNYYEISSNINTDFVYIFKVQATNGLGLGVLSDASASIRAASVPNAPTSLI
jgi:hypothetical protein